MRHRVFGRKLNRDTNHRKALFKNLVLGLITHSRIRTTEAKAKAVRGLVDKLITRAKQGTVPARRVLSSFFHDSSTANKLVDEVAPRLSGRSSGYTRIVRLGNRQGDDATMVKLEFVNAAEMLEAPSQINGKKPAAKRTKTKKPAASLGKKITPTPATLKTPIVRSTASVVHRTQSKG